MNRRQLLLSGVALLVLRKLPAPAPAAVPVVTIADDFTKGPAWLPLDGRVLTRQAYPELHSALGGAFDLEPALDTFALPDLRGRALVGDYRPPPNGPTPDTIAPMILTRGEGAGMITMMREP